MQCETQLIIFYCKDVLPKVEPALLPVTGEQLPAGANLKDGARAHVSVFRLWIPLYRAVLDIKVVNPLARYLEDGD